MEVIPFTSKTETVDFKVLNEETGEEDTVSVNGDQVIRLNGYSPLSPRSMVPTFDKQSEPAKSQLLPPAGKAVGMAITDELQAKINALAKHHSIAAILAKTAGKNVAYDVAWKDPNKVMLMLQTYAKDSWAVFQSISQKSRDLVTKDMQEICQMKEADLIREIKQLKCCSEAEEAADASVPILPNLLMPLFGYSAAHWKELEQKNQSQKEEIDNLHKKLEEQSQQQKKNQHPPAQQEKKESPGERKPLLGGGGQKPKPKERPWWHKWLVVGGVLLVAGGIVVVCIFAPPVGAAAVGAVCCAAAAKAGGVGALIAAGVLAYNS
jgi:hypothetical protein